MRIRATGILREAAHCDGKTRGWAAGQVGKLKVKGRKVASAWDVFAQEMAPGPKSHQGVQGRHYRKGGEAPVW